LGHQQQNNCKPNQTKTPSLEEAKYHSRTASVEGSVRIRIATPLAEKEQWECTRVSAWERERERERGCNSWKWRYQEIWGSRQHWPLTLNTLLDVLCLPQIPRSLLLYPVTLLNYLYFLVCFLLFFLYYANLSAWLRNLRNAKGNEMGENWGFGLFFTEDWLFVTKTGANKCYF